MSKPKQGIDVHDLEIRVLGRTIVPASDAVVPFGEIEETAILSLRLKPESPAYQVLHETFRTGGQVSAHFNHEGWVYRCREILRCTPSVIDILAVRLYEEREL